MPAGFDEEGMRDLALRAKTDPLALRELACRCVDLATRIARRTCHHAEDVDDAVQNMILNTVLDGNAVKYYDSSRSFYTWISSHFAAAAMNMNAVRGRSAVELPVDTVRDMEATRTPYEADEPFLREIVGHLQKRMPDIRNMAEVVYILVDEQNQKSRKNVASIQKACGIGRNQALLVYYVAVVTLRMAALHVPMPTDDQCQNVPSEYSLLPELRAICANRPDLAEYILQNVTIRVPQVVPGGRDQKEELCIASV